MKFMNHIEKNILPQILEKRIKILKISIFKSKKFLKNFFKI